MARNKKAKLFNPNIVRERCMLARQRSGYSRKEAALKMGYVNTTSVSKMESLSSSAPINLEYIMRAAEVYGVSTDYLMGGSNYPERDARCVEQIAVYNSTRQFVESTTDKLMEFFISGGRHHHYRMQCEELLGALTQIIEVINRVRELNPDFDNTIRGGAKLVSLKESLEMRLKQIKIRMIQTQFDEANVKRQFDAVLEEHLKQDDLFKNDMGDS